MIENIFVVLGLTMFWDSMFQKFGLWNDLEELGTKSRFKWFYEFTKCDLCKIFWLTVVMTAVVGLMNGYSVELFMVPFVVRGLLNFKKD